MTRENDLTKSIARPAVVIAGVRSGGTYLAHCLSSHPQIFCDRGESLHHNSLWFTYLKVKPEALLHCLLHMQGYHVSVVKLLYSQAFKGSTWAYLKRYRPTVLWLRRENVIRQSVSLLINRAARGGKIKRPQHTFEETGPLTIGLSADAILKQARGLRERDERAEQMLSVFPRVLKLTYAQIITPGAPGSIPHNTTTRICQFLGVRDEPLRCDLVRVNPQPLAELIRDWEHVETELRASEFGTLLEDDRG